MYTALHLMLFLSLFFNLGAPYQINQNSSSSRKQMKLSAFFSEKQNEIRHQGEQNNQNKDIEFQSSSAQEVSQFQSGEFGSEVSLDNTELSKDSLSSDEQKASSFEERVSGDFAVDEGEYDCETACSERRGNDMDGKFGVAQSPDAKSRCSNLCSTSSTGSHLSILLEKRAAKPSNRPHSTLTDPNFVENYFKVFCWNKWQYLICQFHIWCSTVSHFIFFNPLLLASLLLRNDDITYLPVHCSCSFWSY